MNGMIKCLNIGFSESGGVTMMANNNNKTVYVLTSTGPDGFTSFSVYDSFAQAEAVRARRERKPLIVPDLIRREIVQASYVKSND